MGRPHLPPQADFAWPMPKIELVDNRRFYIKIPTSCFTSEMGRSYNSEPLFSSGLYWRGGTHTPCCPNPIRHFTHFHHLSGPLRI